MNQKEHLDVLRRELQKWTENYGATLLTHMTRLREVSQNGPPDGEGDGSIDAVEWNIMFEQEKTLRKFLQAMGLEVTPP